jgi:7-cyano-7-deazaguanine reductase
MTDDSRLYGEIELEKSKLESFDNRTKDRDYEVKFTCPEFTCLCPRSGFPDFATILIKYRPKLKCVELKSLKLYINQFRDQKIYHEDVTNMILNDLVKLLDPKFIEVQADFNVRGNIHTLVTAQHEG